MARPSATPAAPEYSRTALAPSLLAAIVLMASYALIDTPSWFLYVRYAVSILALIDCVFVWQSIPRQWWWLIGLIPVAVLWNPIWLIDLGDLVVRILTLVVAVFFIVVGVQVRVPTGRTAAQRARYGRR